MAELDLDSYKTLLEFQGFEVIPSDEEFITTRHIVGGQTIELSIRFKGTHTEDYPYQLPAIFLQDREKYGRLAHVSWPDSNNEGFICLGSSESYSLDFRRPEYLLEGLLKDAEALLESLFENPKYNALECQREFAGHWGQAVCGKKHLFYLHESSEEIEELQISHPDKEAKHPLEKGYFAYGKDYGRVSESNRLVWEIKSRGRQRRGRAFKFSLPVLPLPPGPTEDLGKWLESLCQKQGDEFAKRLHRYARQHPAQKACLIFEAEGKGFIARFALMIDSLKKRALPLGKGLSESWKFEAMSVNSCTRDYLLPRGGASESLGKKKVVLFGCGSIGSVLAEQLAALGLRELVLVDPELLSLDNLYRHTLGIEHTHRFKADSLRFSLQQRFPFTQISDQKTSLMQTNVEFIRGSDLIILATGDVTSERGFHELLRKQGMPIPTVTTWLEPMGVGGHVIFSPNNGGEGCYTCAFVRRDDPEVLEMNPNLSFIAEEQEVPLVRSVGSCAGEFLPYSKLDATRTAALAMRSAVGFLTGKVNSAQTRSWCEPELREELEAQNVCYTQRYLNDPDRESCEPLFAETCPCCGKYRS